MLRRETAELLHARAGARARVDANSTAIFDITGGLAENAMVEASIALFLSKVEGVQAVVHCSVCITACLLCLCVPLIDCSFGQF